MPLTLEERRSLFHYDRKLPLDVQQGRIGVEDELLVERFSFAGTKGERVPAVLYRPRGASGRLPVVVVGHGLGSGKDDALMSLLFRDWAARGIACLCVDAPFHGERTERLEHPYLLFSRPNLGLAFAVQTVVDTRRAVDWVESRHDLDSNRLGYAGFSMGSVLGVQFVAMEPRVRAAVFALGGAGMMHYAAGMAPAERRAEFEHVADAVDPMHYAPLIAPRPVLMVNGTRDKVIPAPLGQVLFGCLREPKRIVWYDGEHGDIPHEHIHEMRDFLELNLDGGAARSRTA